MTLEVLAADEIAVAAAVPIVGAATEPWRFLAASERGRALAYRLPADRRRSVVARDIVRRVAARLLDRPAERLEIAIDARGKPAFAGEAAKLRFSIAHGGHVVLVAFAWDREVGVDVEPGDRVADAEALLARYAHPATREGWAALAARDRHDGFLAWWTRTEAALKAIGTGLSLAPSVLAIDPAPGRSEQLVRHEGVALRVVDVAAPRAHRASLCARAGAWRWRMVDLGEVPVADAPR